MKACFKCGITQPLDHFYKHSRMADGHLNKCKTCTKRDVFERSSGFGKEAVRAYDRHRAMRPDRVKARQAYQQTEAGKSARKRSLIKYTDKHPDRQFARRALSNALRDKKLEKWPVCALPECQEKPQGHHPDYSRPLDVVWLCPMHHKKAHDLVRNYRETA